MVLGGGSFCDEIVDSITKKKKHRFAPAGYVCCRENEVLD